MRNLRRAVATLACTAAAMVAIPAGVARADGGAIEGTVTLPDGSPAAQVCVSTLGTTQQTTTDSAGRYHLAVPDGSHLVEFTDCGNRDLVQTWYPGRLDPNEGSPVTVAGTTVTSVDQRLTQGGEISGHVVDVQGNPIASAWVAWQGLAEPEYTNFGATSSGPDGGYVLHGVAPGSWRVSAEDATHPITWSGDTDDWTHATPVSVTAGLVSTGDLHVGRAAVVSGHVDDGLGHPRAGLCVDVYGEADYLHLGSTSTDTNGDYSVAVHPGSLRIAFSACQSPYTWYANGDSYTHATPVAASEGTAVSGLDQTVAQGPHLGGHVTDAAGNPVSAATVFLIDAVSRAGYEYSTTTDTDGSFLFPDLPNKLFIVQARTDGSKRIDLLSRYWPSASTASDAQPVAAASDAAQIDFLLPEGGSISGRVTAAADGSTVAGACVFATGPGGAGANSAADGTYLVQGLEPGSYTVVVRNCADERSLAPAQWQASSGSGSITVASGGTTAGVDVALRPGGGFHGHVADAAGNPIKGICVMSSPTVDTVDARWSYGSAVTDSAGNWSSRNLSDGATYDVTFGPCDPSQPWVPQHASATAVAGSDIALPDTTLHRGGGFTGTVIDQFGHPVYDVCVQAVPRDSGGTNSVRAYTTINGTYDIGALEPGTYTAWFYDCGVGMQQTWWQSPSQDAAATFTVQPDAKVAHVDQTVLIYTLPSSPVDVVGVAGDSSARLTWSPPANDGNTPVTGYDVTTPAGTTTVPADTRSFTVTGLHNGTSYDLAIAARNRKGASEPRFVTVAPQAAASAPSGSTTPTSGTSGSGTSGSGTSAGMPAAAPAAVTLTGSRHASALGTATLRGVVTDAHGLPLGAQRVTVRQRPAGSSSAWSTVASLTSTSDGRWSIGTSLHRPMTYLVAVGSLRATWTVDGLPRITARTSGRTLSLTTTPRRAYAVVLLQRWAGGRWVTWRRLRLTSTGALRVTIPRSGSWRAYLPAAGYWWSAKTPTARIA